MAAGTKMATGVFLCQALLLMVSLSEGFSTGKLLTYRYESSIANGLWDLKKQFGAAKLMGKLEIRTAEPNVLELKLSNMQAFQSAAYDASEFSPDSDEFNPHIEKIGKEVSIQDLEALQAPFVIQLENSVFKALLVNDNEPEWVVNVKKGLASQLQLDKTASRSDGPKLDALYGNTDEHSTAYTVFEDSLSGDCATTIQINQLTDAYADSQARFQTLIAKSLCAGKRKVEVTKTRDFKRCKTSSARHFVIPALYTCDLNSRQCGDALQGTEIARLIGCGDNSGFVNIEIAAYNDFSVAPFGVSTEHLASFSSVILTLENVQQLDGASPSPQPTKTIKSLAFVHTEDPHHATNDAVVKLLEEVAEELKTANRADKDVLGRLDEVRRDLSELNSAELKELWESVKGREIVRDVFLDSVVATGTANTVRLVKELVETKQVEGVKANWMVIAMGYFVRTPTLDLLEDVQAMYNSEAVQSDKKLKNIAALMLADLLSASCDSPFLREKRFSIDLLGDKPCNSKSPVVNSFFESLKKDLSSAESDFDKSVLITALGTLGTKDIIPVLIPYIRGDDDHDDTGLRTRAILSLHRVIFSNPEKLHPMLMALADNIEERPEVRMASVALLLNSANSPLSVWQRVAYRTWFEPSRQVGAFVYNLLKSLSNVPPITHIHKELARKAQLAFDLARPSKFGLPYSVSDMRSSHMSEGLGVIMHTPAWRVADDHLPVAFGNSYWYQLGPFTSNPLAIYIWNYNMDDVWDNLLKRFTGAPVKAKITSDTTLVDSILEAINLKSRPKDKRLGTLQLSLMGSIQRVFDLENIDEVIGQALAGANAQLQKGSLPVSLLKYRNLGEVNLKVPTVNGLSLNYVANLPIIVSMQGKIRKLSTPDAGLAADGSLVISWKLNGEIRTVLPFSSSYIAGGVETHVDSHGPHQLSFALKGPRITVGWTPDEKETDLIRYEVFPYTVARSLDHQIPVTECNEVVPVDARLPAYQKTTHMGECLGLDIDLEITSQLAHNDRADFLDWISKWDINSYSNLGFVPLDLSRRTYVLRYIPSKAKEVKVTFFHKVYPKTNPKTSLYRIDTNEPVAAIAAAPILGLKDAAQEQVVADMKPLIEGGHVRIMSTEIDVGLKDGGEIDVRVILGISHDDDWTEDYTDARFDYIVQKPGEAKQVERCTRIWSNRTWNAAPAFGLSDAELYLIEDTKGIFGKTCDFSNPADSFVLTHVAHVTRDEAAAQAARNSEAGKQCKKDQDQGILDSPACSAAQLLDATYNIYDLRVTYDNLHKPTGDLVWRFGRLINHALYPFIESHEPARNPEKELKLLAKRNPVTGDVDLDFQRPWESISARQVRGYNIRFSPLTTAYSKVFFPLTARTNFLTDARKLSYAGVDEQRCYISANKIVTFDQVAYDYALDSCDHVLMAPAGYSQQLGSWVVLGRHSSSGTDVTIVYGSLKIVLSTSSNSVTVNDKLYPASETSRIELHKAKERVAVITQKDGVITVNGPHLQLKMKQSQVTIRPALDLRGRIAGLCGDYDLETSTEMKTPGRCAVTSGALMAQSFKLSTPSGCVATSDLAAALAAEVATCDSVDQVIRSALPVPKAEDPLKCTSYVPTKLNRDGKVCVSTTKVAQCKWDCRPAYKITRTLGFKCYDPAQVEAALPDTSGVEPDLYSEVTVPSACIGN